MMQGMGIGPGLYSGTRSDVNGIDVGDGEGDNYDDGNDDDDDVGEGDTYDEEEKWW